MISTAPELRVNAAAADAGKPVAARPKVLIVIATGSIGGPGKGLFQFLEHFGAQSGDYILCNFNVRNGPHEQFVQEAKKRGLQPVLLDQRRRIDHRPIVQARALVRKHGLNIVQTHGHKTHLIGLALRVLVGVPWVAFAHGYIHGGWKVRLYNWLDRRALRHADRIVTVSESTTRLLIQHGVPRNKIRLIYNAVDTPAGDVHDDAARIRERHGLRGTDKVVGVIGRLSPEKGQFVFLEAFKLAIGRCPSLKALLIGDGPDRARLEQYVRDNGLSDHVVFTGYREDVAAYYRVLDLLVLPSLSEGLPNVVLEAMSYRVAVLATRVGGVPEVLDGTNGVLVPPSDSAALAAHIADIMTDDPLRSALSTRGFASLHPRFAPQHRAERIVAVYQDVLMARQARAAT